jgi:hypothetical protein
MTTEWELDETADVQWWTRRGSPIGVVRTRQTSGKWGDYAVAYVEDGAPAGDGHYLTYPTLFQAQAVAELVHEAEEHMEEPAVQA